MPRGVGGNSGVPKPNIDLESMDSKHLSGKAKPGTKIEARNVSRSGNDVFVEAGADGKFDLPVKSKKGETVELHIQAPDQPKAASVFVRNDGRDAWSRVAPPDMGDAMEVDLEYIAPPPNTPAPMVKPRWIWLTWKGRFM